jgi:hypothetical protein
MHEGKKEQFKRPFAAIVKGPGFEKGLLPNEA